MYFIRFWACPEIDSSGMGSSIRLVVVVAASLLALSLGQDFGRLPRNAIPSHYDLDIVIVLEEPDFYFQGCDSFYYISLYTLKFKEAFYETRGTF